MIYEALMFTVFIFVFKKYYVLGGKNGNPLRIPAWEVPWIEEPGGLQSMEPQKSKTSLSD